MVSWFENTQKTEAKPFGGLRKAHPVLSEIFLGQGLGIQLSRDCHSEILRVLPRCCPELSCCQEAKNRAEILNQNQRVTGAPEEIRTPDPSDSKIVAGH